MMDATRYRSILFFRDIDKTERTFFNEGSEARRKRERQKSVGRVATESHEKVKGTKFCGKKDDLFIEGSKASLGRPFASSRNRAIP